MVAFRWFFVSAIRGATFHRCTVTTATTAHTFGATWRSGGIVLWLTAVAAIPVGAPFPHIATHIVDTQFIFSFLPYGMGLKTTVVAIPCHAIQIVAATVFIALALVPASAGKFPFRLGGQAEVTAS